jgi:hypothetical protein
MRDELDTHERTIHKRLALGLTASGTVPGGAHCVACAGREVCPHCGIDLPSHEAACIVVGGRLDYTEAPDMLARGAMAGARRDPATVAISDLTIEDAESWCTECGDCFLDANDENSHYEATGHRSTRNIDESFAVRYARDVEGREVRS